MTDREKILASLLAGGALITIIGGVGVLFSKQLNLNEREKRTMKNTAALGVIALASAFVYAGFAKSKIK